VQTIISEIAKQLNNNMAEKIRDGLVITILGKPNVGKSTLINLLTKRDLAIVSNIAGTTRDSLEAHFEISGIPVTLIDTAGIRETNDEIEEEGVRRALEKAEKSDFKIYIIDATNPEIDENLIDENTLVLLNKCDLSAKITAIHKSKNCYTTIKTSLKDGEGVDEILANLEAIAQKYSGASESGIITRARHRNLLQDTLENLNNFIEVRKNNMPIEIAAENLRLASFGIGKVIGKIDVEDVLDKIFSEFCIGK
jgi:tRNA modification GTPase